MGRGEIINDDLKSTFSLCPVTAVYIVLIFVFIKFDRTEEIKDNLNPDWEHKFNLDYYFEEKQYLKFEV